MTYHRSYTVAGFYAAGRALRLIFGAALLLGLVLPIQAGPFTSNFITVSLRANAKESLSVTAAPALVNFNLLPLGGVSNGSVPVVIRTSWQMRAGRRQVRLFAYFTSAAAALSNGGGTNLPSSRVLGSTNAGPFRAITQNSPFGAGRSLQLFNQRIRAGNRNAGRTDRLRLRVDTTGLRLPAGVYSGLLILQARAI